MTKTNNLITINGTAYDARSGLPAAHRPRNIDGIVRSNQPAAQPHKAAAAVTPAPAAAKPHPAKPARSGAPHAATHHARPSHTLMRQTVRKPSKRLHLSELHAVAPAPVAAPQLDVALAPKLSFTTVDDRRATRARHVAKSKYVSRFGDAPTPSGARVVPAAVPVAAKPVVQIQPLAPAPHAQQRSMDIFERALKQANAHEQAPPARKERAAKKPRKTKSRLAGGLAASLAVVVLGGFLAYQNMANVTVRVAGARAGFAATLPGYKPAGFSVGKFAYSPGHVTINFSSGSDGRHFALTEQPSNWDSATLLNDFVASATDQYQTVQTAGRTLYIYGKNSATWVNGGVWYRVDSDNALSTTQLVNLASSM